MGAPGGPPMDGEVRDEPVSAKLITLVGEAAAQPGDAMTAMPRVGRAELNRRVVYLMLFRLVLISLVLGVTILLSWLSDVDPLAPNSLVLFAIIGTTYLLTLIYSLAIKRGLDPMRLADAQMVADLITSTLLVHITGGAQSAYTFFFPLSIIGAATVRFRGGAVAVASASVLLFVGVSLLGWAEILPTPGGQRVLPNDLSSVELSRAMALNLAAFAGVAFLAFNLGAQIQRTSASLLSERTAAADLFALHEDIVRSLSSGLITIDRRHHVLTINRAACAILATDAGSSVGRPVEQLLPGLEIALEPPLRDAQRFDFTVEGSEHSALILGMTTSPLRNNQDVVIGRILSFQDLTELRAMEAQVQRAERLAVIGSLAAGVAHEIRNPLASISGSVELLSNDASDQEDNRPLMNIITREIDRLNGMISDLLDYANPHPRKSIEFDLAVMVCETIQVFEQDRHFEAVELTLTDDSPREGLRLVADPGKLRQVLWNLLRNAAEAAASSPGAAVKVAVKRAPSAAVIEVVDNGPGLSAEHLAQIFDPFFTTKTRGSGLGLATSHNIVTEHNGRLEVDSDLGAGCRFTVTIPFDLTPIVAGDSTSSIPAYNGSHD